MVIIEKGSDQLPREKSSRTAVIMSYDLMVSKREHIREYGFQAIIFVRFVFLAFLHYLARTGFFYLIYFLIAQGGIRYCVQFFGFISL